MFEFESDYFIHEGGTKYYQIFKLRNTVNGFTCVVTHWGAYTKGAARAPKLHGKAVKVDCYTNHYDATKFASGMRKKKINNGYNDWDNFDSRIETEHLFEKYLLEWFKTADANLIFNHMVNEITEADIADDYPVKPINYDEYEKNRAAKQEAYELERDAREAAAKLKQEEQKAKLDNPNWGVW